MAAKRPVSFEDLVDALPRFVFIPAGAAGYDQDADAAATLLRTTPEDAAKLAAAGLPHRMDSERGPLFEYVDLMNLGRFSGTRRTVPETTAEYLMRFAAEPAKTWMDPYTWLVTVRVPEPGRWRVRVPDLHDAAVQAVPAAGVRWPDPAAAFTTDSHQVVVRITGVRDTVRDPRIRDVHRETLDPLRAGTVTYQGVAEPLRMRHHEAWALGMSDCVVISRVFTDRLRELGLTARSRRGYILGLVSSEHAWTEVFEDGRWKTIDAGFGYLPPGLSGLRVEADEFMEASFGCRCNRMLPCGGEDAEPLAYPVDGDVVGRMVATVSATQWRQTSAQEAT